MVTLSNTPDPHWANYMSLEPVDRVDADPAAAGMIAPGGLKIDCGNRSTRRGEHRAGVESPMQNTRLVQLGNRLRQLNGGRQALGAGAGRPLSPPGQIRGARIVHHQPGHAPHLVEVRTLGDVSRRSAQVQQLGFAAVLVEPGGGFLGGGGPLDHHPAPIRRAGSGHQGAGAFVELRSHPIGRSRHGSPLPFARKVWASSAPFVSRWYPGCAPGARSPQ